MKLAITSKDKKNIKKFKKYVYRAEDAWRQVVLLTKKPKRNSYGKKSNNRRFS